jgi:hypothetical protein
MRTGPPMVPEYVATILRLLAFVEVCVCIQIVVAEGFPLIAVELIGAGFDRGIDTPSVE